MRTSAGINYNIYNDEAGTKYVIPGLPMPKFGSGSGSDKTRLSAMLLAEPTATEPDATETTATESATPGSTNPSSPTFAKARAGKKRRSGRASHSRSRMH
ncbi:hypothetical protein DL764_007092 [Monosporascus ibericus]|uniref:Uncharacterized protein n=1 Tax=Monosporascus ibericus TaxID=155417 RepID=A0A4V1X9W3_9PEZI|nr:hypothetical protein DL764_007092 [Monosporascus ibericus]